jgi:GntR family transcriptional regulator
MELLQARMPTPDEVRMLELDPGVPVVRMPHIGHYPDGRTLQVADDLYAGPARIRIRVDRARWSDDV